MRLLYWPNEPINFDEARLQVGGRLTFDLLRKRGKISALEIYPYRERINALGEDFLAEALGVVEAFNPDIIFIQHVTGNKLPDGLWRDIKVRAPGATLVYHDADPYSAMSKRIDKPMIDVLREADLSLVCGLGYIHEQFSKLSPGEVKYLPHCFDTKRFKSNDVRAVAKEYDLVMIGNRGVRRRLKFLYQPGGRTRAKLAEAASREFGATFALFGNGWDGLAANRGRLDFAHQEIAIQRARISINWDHFDDIPYYFSDRLPISLAAGVPHVTSAHAGYEHLFQDCRGLFSCKSWQEVLDCSRWLLSKSDTDLQDLGLKAREWVTETLEAEKVFERAFDMSVAAHNKKRHQAR